MTTTEAAPRQHLKLKLALFQATNVALVSATAVSGVTPWHGYLIILATLLPFAVLVYYVEGKPR